MSVTPAPGSRTASASLSCSLYGQDAYTAHRAGTLACRLKCNTDYRWDAVLKYWWCDIPHAELEGEQAWLKTDVYTGWGEPALHEVT